MIDSTHLFNFKSYSDYTFNFHPGINLFVGSSNNGKSSVFRAFYWIINNRPMGKSVISYWNRDKKGDPIDPSKVSLTIDGKKILRVRKPGKNSYQFNGVVYSALKGNVPDTIKDFLNISDINIQKQKEEPFLISFSAEKAAKYLNSIIKLDVIDDCLSYVKQKKKECENALKVEVKELESLQVELKSLSWLNDANELLQKVERLDKEKSGKENILTNLKESILNYEQLKESSFRFELITKLENIVLEISQVELELIEKEKQKDFMFDLIFRYEQAEKILKKSEMFLGVESIIIGVGKIEKELEEKRGILSNWDREISSYEENIQKVNFLHSQIIDLKKSLPELCPICGNRMENK